MAHRLSACRPRRVVHFKGSLAISALRPPLPSYQNRQSRGGAGRATVNLAGRFRKFPSARARGRGAKRAGGRDAGDAGGLTPDLAGRRREH